LNSLNYLSATELAARLQTRDIRALDLLEACLDRIAARDADVRAWQRIDAQAARTRAVELDSGPLRGPLHGLPIGVKDIFDTYDLATEYGSPIYANHQPPADAACVALARAAGAIVLGKTTTTEFANFNPTATRNPYDLAHTPGGSSSGSAAAVADRMVPLAFGTQTVGSIVRPASFCGIVGYKPTFSTVSRSGVKLVADSLDTVGVFARSTADAALLVGTLTGRADLLGLPAVAKHLRVGLCRTHDWNLVGNEVIEAMDVVPRKLEQAGATLLSIELPQDYLELHATQAAILGYEMSRNLACEYARHADRISPKLRAALAEGQQVSASAYDQARRHARDCQSGFDAVIEDCDVLLAPSATGEAPKGLRSTGDPVMSRIWTLLGLPCISLPLARGPNGLPVGLTVIGRRGDDSHTLAAAQWIHAHAAAKFD
jgi:Asp-tRNA(Asn)/Glu-tRNA(Gln) amidotransferase A subunit family amidase